MSWLCVETHLLLGDSALLAALLAGRAGRVFVALLGRAGRAFKW